MTKEGWPRNGAQTNENEEPEGNARPKCPFVARPLNYRVTQIKDADYPALRNVSKVGELSINT